MRILPLKEKHGSETLDCRLMDFQNYLWGELVKQLTAIYLYVCGVFESMCSCMSVCEHVYEHKRLMLTVFLLSCVFLS